jgi:uncharacterized protein
MYVRSQDIKLLNDVINNPPKPSQIAFIAPLDNLIWDRRLLKDLFNFEYRWEVYTPQVQRSYGYYVLPVLFGDQFIARFEPIRDRKNGLLTIKNWWWNSGIEPTPELVMSLQESLEYFCSFLDIQQISIGEFTASTTDVSLVVNILKNLLPRSR